MYKEMDHLHCHSHGRDAAALCTRGRPHKTNFHWECGAVITILELQRPRIDTRRGRCRFCEFYQFVNTEMRLSANFLLPNFLLAQEGHNMTTTFQNAYVGHQCNGPTITGYHLITVQRSVIEIDRN
jgi:hypothetical protein